MAKDTYYFSHDYNARNDEKILELRVKYGAEGYGLFWMLVETMAENENGGAKASLIGGLSLGYGVAKEKLVEFIKYCVEIELFYEDGGFLFSRRMKKHKDFRNNLSVKGKEGAIKRWATDSPPNGEGNAKERKGKENKEKEDILPKINSNLVCYDVEDFILKSQKTLEGICIATSKGIEEAKKELHQYHLWLEKKEKYPMGNKAVTAGFESWLHNKKEYNKKYGSPEEETIKKMVF